jgi:hypothetical protein
MAFDLQAGGHAFDLVSKKCGECGMTRENYDDHGKLCTGRHAAAPRQDDKPQFISDDPFENDR